MSILQYKLRRPIIILVPNNKELINKELISLLYRLHSNDTVDILAFSLTATNNRIDHENIKEFR